MSATVLNPGLGFHCSRCGARPEHFEVAQDSGKLVCLGDECLPPSPWGQRLKARAGKIFYWLLGREEVTRCGDPYLARYDLAKDRLFRVMAQYVAAMTPFPLKRPPRRPQRRWALDHQPERLYSLQVVPTPWRRTWQSSSGATS
jgi:hypothetical protein